ncbi:hypothetical protein [Haloactinospora alba]|uniref:hypothetical protein n=1 Tax=Haloactinospora alba TaxID=405555 RepID=UPI00114F5C7B|nr:hypothetical protein [Haloactinospora alba]
MVVDIVDWLATGEEKRSRVARVGSCVCDDTLKDIDGYARRNSSCNGDLRKGRYFLTGHFWCALLADVSRAADAAHENVDGVPERATEALFGSGENPGWGETKFYVAEFALAGLWSYVKPLAVAWDLESLVRTIRVLAVLICPDPGSHPRVARLCMSPLATDILTVTAESRLHQGFGAALDAASAA